MEMRAGLVLLARTGSSRLPRKSLLDVCGRPVLSHQLDRLKASRRARLLLLATTTLTEDDELCDVAREAGIEVFRGSVHDVVDRLVGAAHTHGLSFLAVVGGDDVFCDGELVDFVIADYERSRADFIEVVGLPFGTTPFGVTATALRRVLDIKASEHSDGWERYLTETGLFVTRSLNSPNKTIAHPELRLDLDYPEDLELMRAIYGRLYRAGEVPSLGQVVRLLTEDEPELAQLNQAAHERWLRDRASMPLPLKAP